jgi:hypothetical protein
MWKSASKQRFGVSYVGGPLKANQIHCSCVPGKIKEHIRKGLQQGCQTILGSTTFFLF